MADMIIRLFYEATDNRYNQSFFFFDSTPGRRSGEKRRTTKTNPSSIARETLFFAFFFAFFKNLTYTDNGRLGKTKW